MGPSKLEPNTPTIQRIRIHRALKLCEGRPDRNRTSAFYRTDILASPIILYRKMAISSLSASTIPSLNTPSSTSKYLSTVSSFSSLQFPAQLCRLQFRKRWISSPSRPRILPLVAAKQTFSTLDELVEKSDKPVLVDFYATWCGPCQFMAPILNEVSAVLEDTVQVVKIDTEKYPSIADKYRIEALPTFIIFKDGKPCDRFEGALTKDQLIQRVENSLNVKQ